MKYFELEKEILWGFAFHDDLLHSIDTALKTEIDERKSLFEELSSDYDPQVLETAWSEGFTTPAKLKDLTESNPDRAEEVKRNLQRRMELYGPILKLTLTEQATVLAWQSSFLSVMAHFESSLFRLSHFLATEEDKSHRLEGDTYLNDYKRIISEITDFDFGGSQEWEAMLKHRKLRNLITHGAGVIDHAGKELKEYVVGNECFQISDIGQVNLSKEYVAEVNRTAWNFMVDVGEKLTSST